MRNIDHFVNKSKYKNGIMIDALSRFTNNDVTSGNINDATRVSRPILD